MTTTQVILLDHLVALSGAAVWTGSGVAAALRRPRLTRSLVAAAVFLTIARVVTVIVLAGRGWWFAEEKALLALPMLGAAGTVALVVAGPTVFATRRRAGRQVSTPVVVALLSTGYAALAGVGVTLTAGYPLAWSTAVLAIAGVAGAALLTQHVLAGHATEPAVESPRRAALSRRRFLNLAGAVALVGAAGNSVIGALRSTTEVSTGGGPGPATGNSAMGGMSGTVSVTDLRGPDRPGPGGTIRRHVLTAQRSTLRLASGRQVDGWTYNGQSPGPAITATQGDLVEVRLRNSDIEDGVSLHWHGYDVPCGEDGVPGLTQRAVAPGDEFVYRFRADQAGTYWYHTHFASHIGVRRGLYGTLVVQPRDGGPVGADRGSGLDLTLPVHTFDGVVVIGDEDGRFTRTAPPGSPVRLRLLNTDSDPHRFALVGTPFRVAAVDGRDLHEPGDLRQVGLRLAAGGRHDLVFTMPEAPVTLVVGNRGNGLVLTPPGGSGATGGAALDAIDTSGWPDLDLLEYGTPAEAAFEAAAADRHFTMVLDRGLALVDGTPAYAQTVNGRAHPSIPDQLVAEGDVVRLTVVNRSLETHPWHLHGHPVLVLSRDGRPSSGSPLWLDTFDVRPGEVWEVAFRATNRGIWMNHCHNLPHAEQGMMLQLRYDGVTALHDH